MLSRSTGARGRLFAGLLQLGAALGCAHPQDARPDALPAGSAAPSAAAPLAGLTAASPAPAAPTRKAGSQQRDAKEAPMRTATEGQGSSGEAAQGSSGEAAQGSSGEAAPEGRERSSGPLGAAASRGAGQVPLGAGQVPSGPGQVLVPSATSSSGWCSAGLVALDADTCAFLPAHPTRELLLYFHGIVPPRERSAALSNLREVLTRACSRAGVALLLPRGPPATAGKLRGWATWPTDAAGYEARVGALVARFSLARARLEGTLGRRFARLYVAGSSAGAYFAARLALRGDLPADGYALLSGGAGGARELGVALSPRPVYVGFGAYDTVGPAARALARRLAAAGWPVEVAMHPVGHGAREVYLDEAFAFWRRTLGPVDR